MQDETRREPTTSATAATDRQETALERFERTARETLGQETRTFDENVESWAADPTASSSCSAEPP